MGVGEDGITGTGVSYRNMVWNWAKSKPNLGPWLYKGGGSGGSRVPRSHAGDRGGEMGAWLELIVKDELYGTYFFNLTSF